jgi:hypothetical protein
MLGVILLIVALLSVIILSVVLLFVIASSKCIRLSFRKLKQDFEDLTD